MQEDTRSNKELIMTILEKCKQTLPQLAVISKRLQKSQGSPPKIKKKNCLNPTFLLRLSECGENIRLVLQRALAVDFKGRQTLKRLSQEYMQVILDIRKYHEQAHKSYDMHANSTQMKKNLLDQLKEETAKRQALQRKVQTLMSQRAREGHIKDQMMRELEERSIGGNPGKDDINISHISKISKRGGGASGQFYGGEDPKIGTLEDDYQYTVETARLRKKIIELEEQLEQKDQQHKLQLEGQKIEILQLESKFQDLLKASYTETQPLRGDLFNSPKIQRVKEQGQLDQICRLLIIQATTVEQFLCTEPDE